MAPTLTTATESLDSSPVNRRSHRRYPIALSIDYKLLNQDRVEHRGSGKTVNVSSAGILFEADMALPLDTLVAILMDWPFLQDGVHPLKLVILARIVRSHRQLVAVRIGHLEFVTADGRSSGSQLSFGRIWGAMM